MNMSPESAAMSAPDAIVPGIGGQTGLNLAMQLAKKGVLEECEIELLGTDAKVSGAPRTASFSRSFAKESASRWCPLR